MTHHFRPIGLPALAVAFVLPLTLSAGAQTEPAPAQAEVTDTSDTPPTTPETAARENGPDLTTFTLDNGLQVVVLPDNRAPIVTQMVYYHVGSADEAPGKSGIAHFLEHLMFKGTKNHPTGEYSRRVADIGGQENAFTTSDYTGYYQQVPADALAMVMEMEADRMENLVLSEEAVLPERDVILEERRMRIDNDPGSQLSEAVQAALFQNSPYGTPVIGWRQEMEGLTRDDAIAFYDKYYTPNNATLLIAGDVDVAEVRDLVAETYGKVERRADPGDRVRPVEPEPLAERTVTLTDPRVTQPSLQTAYLVPSERRTRTARPRRWTFWRTFWAAAPPAASIAGWSSTGRWRPPPAPITAARRWKRLSSSSTARRATALPSMPSRRRSTRKSRR